MVEKFEPRKPNLAVIKGDRGVVVASADDLGVLKCFVCAWKVELTRESLCNAFALARRASQSIGPNSFKIMPSPAVRRRVVRCSSLLAF